MDTSFWTNQWGDKILFGHGSSRSAGAALCFNDFPGEIITHQTDTEGHWLTALVKTDDAFIILCNIFRYNNDNQNKTTLEDLTKVILELRGQYFTDYILMGGDWNMIPD
ncbi:hypothetical protein XENOCAPTIV_015032 [Xenoophorus captivus]|uniref:Endonuclease/exonuclease/phosphatase domain-containing protein n=1 Tax=Xenoophorus captivus TaxID=1517983 RepID=A0ABV0RYT7_9TELE